MFADNANPRRQVLVPTYIISMSTLSWFITLLVANVSPLGMPSVKREKSTMTKKEFLRVLEENAIPAYEKKAADSACEDASTLIATGISDKLRLKLEAERLLGCKVDFNRDTEGLWNAVLVKMRVKGHQVAVCELQGQCADYAEAQELAGVLPELEASGGLKTTNNGDRKDPDAGLWVSDLIAQRGDYLLLCEVDVTNNAPVGIAKRAVELFSGYDSLRYLVQVKFYPRRTRREGELGPIPAVCWVLGKDESDVVHVKRIFEMGTAPNRGEDNSNHYKASERRGFWTRSQKRNTTKQQGGGGGNKKKTKKN